MASGTDPNQEQEAIRQRALAESKFKSSDLNSALKHARKAYRLSPKTDGLSSIVTALEILNAAARPAVGDLPDWYKILQVEPFSHINTVKKQYRKLALILHPDKNPYLGCEEAFKLANEGFRFFSDSIRRKEYDMKLRIKIQEESVSGLAAEGGDDDETATFWTACLRCRLRHKFQRKYLGHNLMCPNCKKSFEAKEVESANEDSVVEEESGVALRSESSSGVNSKIKTYTRRKIGRGGGNVSGGDGGGGDSDDGQWGGGRLRSEGLRRKMSNIGEVLSKEKESEDGDEMMTLSQMQLEIKRKANKERVKSKINEKEKDEEVYVERDKREKSLNKDSASEDQRVLTESDNNNKEFQWQEASKKKRRDLTKVVDLGIEPRVAKKRSYSSKGGEKDMEIMMVEDSNFYDFGKDRMERSFKKGQVWAIYDDDDEMPRHYGLIDEVVSLNPFEVNIRWLYFLNDGNGKLVSLGKIGSCVPCGRFKVSKKTQINQLKIFSHAMDCERAAREIYRIYPKKGSVWAVYTEPSSGSERRNISGRDKNKRCYYDIVVCLTSYSEIHGLSMAYLQKVDGFKVVFKRREIGLNAIRWIEKGEIADVLSHQIPVRKLPEDHRISGVSKERWELDPASVPSDLVITGTGR